MEPLFGLQSNYMCSFSLIHVQTWNRQLCNEDSDGDGTKNGVELGDPGCQWTPTNDIALRPPSGHPG